MNMRKLLTGLVITAMVASSAVIAAPIGNTLTRSQLPPARPTASNGGSISYSQRAANLRKINSALANCGCGMIWSAPAQPNFNGGGSPYNNGNSH